jgi:hypothetical protein
MKYRHGLNSSNSPLYCAWSNMRARCNNPNALCWANYGGRGIKIHKRWNSFELFALDVGPHPGKGWALDRPKNNNDYGPNNWRWATRLTQNRNRRNVISLSQARDIRRRVQIGSRQHPGNVLALAAEFGVSRATIYDIQKQRSWSVR